jgi:hypothetical protein
MVAVEGEAAEEAEEVDGRRPGVGANLLATLRSSLSAERPER